MPQKSSSSMAALQQNVSLVVVVVVIVVLVVLVVLLLVVVVVILVVLVLVLALALEPLLLLVLLLLALLLLVLLPCRRPSDLPSEALAGCSDELAPAAAPWERFADSLCTRARMASWQSSPMLCAEQVAQRGQSSRTCSRARPQGFGSLRKVVCCIAQRMRTLQDRSTPWWEHKESQPDGAAQAREAAPRKRVASKASMDPRARPPARARARGAYGRVARRSRADA